MDAGSDTGGSSAPTSMAESFQSHAEDGMVQFEIPDAPDSDAGAENDQPFFAHGDKQFKSPEELAAFIKQLENRQSAPAPDGQAQYSQLSRGLQSAMARIEQLQSALAERNGQGQSAGQQAGQTETNPHDPDVKPQEWHQWEMDHRLQARDAEWGQRFESLQEMVESQQKAAFGQAVLSNYKQTFSQVAGELRIDPEYRDLVEWGVANSQDVNSSIDPRTGEVDPAVVRKTASQLASWVQSLVDKKLSAASKDQGRLMKKHPPSLTRGASTSVPSGGKTVGGVPPSTRKGMPDSYNRIGQMLAARQPKG